MKKPLSRRKCVPCEGSTRPLSRESISELLHEVKQWTLVEDFQIEKTFQYKNFKDAIKFVNTVADLAEKEGHHPDIFLYGWNKVKIILRTHAIQGLSNNDFILAAKINEIKI